MAEENARRAGSTPANQRKVLDDTVGIEESLSAMARPSLRTWEIASGNGWKYRLPADPSSSVGDSSEELQKGLEEPKMGESFCRIGGKVCYVKELLEEEQKDKKR